jgi:hypothetical protein
MADEEDTPVKITMHSDSLPPGSIIIPDPYESYPNSLPTGKNAESFYIAKDSMALQLGYLNINNQDSIESVIDPSSEIIATSEEICHNLSLAYDPSLCLNRKSVNSTTDLSLGLACNIPCHLAKITLFLQIHVIKNLAYNILLSRPFDVLKESVIKNYCNKDQTITICNPNSNCQATVPTVPHGKPWHDPNCKEPYFQK